MTNERLMTAADHNAQVEAERRAYHERRCRESEGYKRVYEYITGAFQRVREQVSQGLTMTQQTMQQCNADATGAPTLCEGTATKMDSLSSLFAVGSFGGQLIYRKAYKDECEHLFAKLKAMGFEWDAEKKDIVKIKDD